MTRSVAIADLLSDPAALVRRVVSDRETVVLVDGDHPVAEIRPVSKPKSERTLGEVFAALPHLTPEEAEAFGHDIDEARKAADRIPMRDPWESRSTPACISPTSEESLTCLPRWQRAR